MSESQNPTDVDVSVIVVNYNTAHLLKDMRDALKASTGQLKVETIIVDNASRDDSVSLLKHEFSDAKLIFNDRNLGFGRANNQGLAVATGRYILLLNTDAFVAPDTLMKTVTFMNAHEEFGILGVRLVGRDGVLQPCCRYFPTPWNLFVNRTGLHRMFPRTRMVDDMGWDHASVRECDWVIGCYYLIRRAVIDQVGLFDPRYFLYSEEVDHCHSSKSAGWKVVYFPDTTVVHIGGESAKSDSPLSASGQISSLQIESELLYFRKHHGISGAMTALALSSIADVVIAVKNAVRGRWERVNEANKHLSLYWASVFSTRLGSRPTR